MTGSWPKSGAAKLNYHCDGAVSAPVLVLSHSLGCDLAMWTPQLPELVKRFRVLRYDSRGHGASVVTPGPYRIETLAGDVLRLLDELKIERVHFCGLSLGGMVGMWLAVHAPERLDHLVLANTAARIAPPELWDARIQAIRERGMPAIGDAVLARWLSADFLAREPERAARMLETLTGTSVEGYTASCAAIRDLDLRHEISAIRSPTLVITGALDAATPPADCQFLARQIAGARYLELPAAHLSNLEAPEAFTSALVAFLSPREPEHG
jgi:3-oxoadipate enol-lactonase